MMKNLILGPILAQIWAPNFFWGFYFYYMLDIVASYHCMQFQGKLINQTWENGKNKTNFGPDFGLFGPNLGPKIFFKGFTILDVRYYCKLSLNAISRKTDDPNSRKWEKLLLGLIQAPWTQIQMANFVFQKSGFVSY